MYILHLPQRESSRVSPSELVAQFCSLRVDYPLSLQESHVALLHVPSHSSSWAATKSPDRSQEARAFLHVASASNFCLGHPVIDNGMGTSAGIQKVSLPAPIWVVTCPPTGLKLVGCARGISVLDPQLSPPTTTTTFLTLPQPPPRPACDPIHQNPMSGIVVVRREKKKTPPDSESADTLAQMFRAGNNSDARWNGSQLAESSAMVIVNNLLVSVLAQGALRGMILERTLPASPPVRLKGVVGSTIGGQGALGHRTLLDLHFVPPILPALP
ncbi:hypothetical protein BD779DRAFT_1478369 [Infundibulicybe gibba]|nr:hypothetical protein BD779DRAFT_1478369 [Infundibulicybe gibba]